MWKPLTILVCSSAFAQTPGPTTFDIASVRPAGERSASCGGGPGTPSPGQYTCKATLSYFISAAFDLQPYQYTATTEGQPYAITAKMPEGTTTQAQVRVMLQNLLIERFQLAYHHDTKEMQVYDLMIAKGGLKMKESPDPDTPVTYPPESHTVGNDGFPVQIPRRDMVGGGSRVDGGTRIFSAAATTKQLIARLTAALKGAPIVDKTDLTAKYAFTLTFKREPYGQVTEEFIGPTLFEALPSQLGLRLERNKEPVQIFVVDHAESKPIEN